ncbi:MULTISPECIES: hypothetical protein [unclassified Sporosarcina]|uniref:hypothetical protein n=1 Tax=unclassified Sporosarcina TaxID=2647733 RepID=UPI0030F5EB48
MESYFSPYVHYLLLPYSEQTSVLIYGNQFLQVEVPQIGPRPPFYSHPVYDSYLPVI